MTAQAPLLPGPVGARGQGSLGCRLLAIPFFTALAGAHSVDMLTRCFPAPEKNPVDMKGEGNETSNMVITWKVTGPGLSTPLDIRPGPRCWPLPLAVLGTRG